MGLIGLIGPIGLIKDGLMVLQWAGKEWTDREVSFRIKGVKRFSFGLLRKRIPKDLRFLLREGDHKGRPYGAITE